MASFHEGAVFPRNIAYGSRAAPRFSTSIVKKRSGAEERVARWSYPLHSYDVKYGLRNYADVIAVQKFFINRLGPAHGFRFRDPTDFTTQDVSAFTSAQFMAAYINGSTPTFIDVVIGTGDGVTKTFQLVKKYIDTVITRTRNLVKPVSGTVKSGVNGVEKTITTDWSVDTATGIITYGTAPPNGQPVTAGCEFDVPVRFDESLDEGLFLELRSFGGGDIPSIPLLEDLHGGIVAEEYFYGGSQFLSFGVGISISPNDGRVLVLSPAATGLSITLPDTTNLADGGPWFYLVNTSSNGLTVRNSAGVAQFSLGSAASATVVLATVGGARTWYGF